MPNGQVELENPQPLDLCAQLLLLCCTPSRHTPKHQTKTNKKTLTHFYTAWERCPPSYSPSLLIRCLLLVGVWPCAHAAQLSSVSPVAVEHKGLLAAMLGWILSLSPASLSWKEDAAFPLWAQTSQMQYLLAFTVDQGRWESSGSCPHHAAQRSSCALGTLWQSCLHLRTVVTYLLPSWVQVGSRQRTRTYQPYVAAKGDKCHLQKLQQLLRRSWARQGWEQQWKGRRK